MRSIIERIQLAEREVNAAKLNRDESYKAFATFVRQRMEKNGINGAIVCQRMGWKRHTLGNLLNQGDRLPESEMLRLVDALHPITAAERGAR
ncbi:hypothetical protein UFOVP817_40 [uncultured Caudovirales phage]|uniref:Uncharacterized protein n=1 Tax=uncultured Caudovirales phage TaxID=2100421 RepID=A0A6J5P7K8_9CAUD|nr:hypothetical protein UFOVP817_40 [uncultured Caudovirales phage]